MKSVSGKTLLLFILMAILLSACGNSAANNPASAVENYWQALVAKDSARLSGLSCAAFEPEALTTLESFRSVDVVVEDLACSATDQTDSATTVKCSGKIIASYGAENLVIDLSERTYSAAKESGDWRMCGAK